jgi:hypothetical protein
MFNVAFEVIAPLTKSDPSSEFIQQVTGEIRESQSGHSVGRIHATLVQVGRAADAGEDLFDVMDGVSEELVGYHHTFFKSGCWEYRDSIREQFEIALLDLLIIQLVEIEPEFRGQRIGLLAISKVVDIFGENCGLVAIKPFPLQFSNFRDSGRCSPNEMDAAEIAFQRATQKLRRYWDRAGFRRVCGTDYSALSPALRRPDVRQTALGVRERYSSVRPQE